MPAAKPYLLLINENKSHRTKEELAERKKAEEELFTGEKLKEKAEIRQNEISHGEFLRVKRLLKAIGKDDDIFSGPINRYCRLLAECEEFEKKKAAATKRLEELTNLKDDFGDDVKAFFQLTASIEKHIIDFDKQIQTKRKMMFDIEKENLMTVAAAMRSIPKQPQKKKSKLEEALK